MLLLTDRGRETHLDQGALAVLADSKVEHVLLDSIIKVPRIVPVSLDIRTIPTSSLPWLAGPYLGLNAPNGHGWRLFPVYRLYPDRYRTFISGLYPSGDNSGRYETLEKLSTDGEMLIPVPSRLYTQGWNAAASALPGKRIAIKGERSNTTY
jgi:hypothetical protein